MNEDSFQVLGVGRMLKKPIGHAERIRAARVKRAKHLCSECRDPSLRAGWPPRAVFFSILLYVAKGFFDIFVGKVFGVPVE